MNEKTQSCINVNPGYECLAEVLHEALDQAQNGKGHERHADGRTFKGQPILVLQRMYGVGFAAGQAAKKVEEAQRLPYEQARKEILGAINYLAAMAIRLDEIEESKKNSSN